MRGQAAVSYVCAVGKTAKQSTLEPTKQCVPPFPAFHAPTPANVRSADGGSSFPSPRPLVPSPLRRIAPSSPLRLSRSRRATRSLRSRRRRSGTALSSARWSSVSSRRGPSRRSRLGALALLLRVWHGSGADRSSCRAIRTFYIMACVPFHCGTVGKEQTDAFVSTRTDHLIDMPTRALTGQVVKGRGSTSPPPPLLPR